MIPTRREAERLLREAEQNNPGPWGNHSRVAAHCAEKIAESCDGMDADKAYVLGLLHDIGRKFGVRHLGHVSDGYTYMMSLGYDEVAKICLTHSFNNQSTEEYNGERHLRCCRKGNIQTIELQQCVLFQQSTFNWSDASIFSVAEKNASTTAGSKCVPDSSLIIAYAFSSGIAFL